MPHHPFFAPQLPPDAKEGQDQRHGRASAERHGGGKIWRQRILQTSASELKNSCSNVNNLKKSLKYSIV